MFNSSVWRNFTLIFIHVNSLYESSYLELVVYLKEIVEHFILFCVFYIVVCILLYFGIKWKLVKFGRSIKSPKKVLLVTAHPDDECMFFGPTILNLRQNKDCTIFLMCLSTGKNYGMGAIRKKELYESCKVLGIKEEKIIIQGHSDMPDDIKVKWPEEIVGSLILHQIETYNIDTVITFDKHGVSKHANHCSIYYAIAYLSLQRQLPEYCTVYVLESINLLRKYWFIFDIPISFLLSRTRYIAGPNDRYFINKAMKKHVSQLVWFRKLYLIFSRYVFINTLQKMNLTDIELDLSIED